ncbi:conserved Plasmodium protein, unknown function [Plasmodium malariae]|uniref:Uncharacterized protein n=1 Tax=Plasmodium malariae TaxID=5858 RepID=A0A1D3JJ35_PLAMA|nr:conserved Plasmodium protein, unknown function [Plasmodium malariae]SBT86526.1 conserved Plasmodium protein, unknown function [Plasmodium malariae]
MSSISERFDEYDEESDDEHFEIKNKIGHSDDEKEGSEEYEEEEADELSDEEGEGDELEEEDEEAEEDDELNTYTIPNENIEDDIFNENNLLHAIKTREILEQDILVLFSNMLKKETVLNKDIKNNIGSENNNSNMSSRGRGNNTEDKNNIDDDCEDDHDSGRCNGHGGSHRVGNSWGKEPERGNLKIKNQSVYNFIYSKMYESAKESDKKKQNKKEDNEIIEKNKQMNKEINFKEGQQNMVVVVNSKRIQQIDKEHYILDTNIVQIINDINTYLKREREYLNRKIGTHIDSTFKNPMYVTLYIYNNQILKDIIIQVINIIKNDFDNSIYKDIDENMLIKNMFILIYYLTSRPSKEWFDYWHRHMPSFNNKKSNYNVYNYLQIEKKDRKIFSNALKNDIYIKELQKRSNIIEQYQNGLQSLKCLLASKNFLTMLNEFRYNCQLFIDADYRGIEENEKVIEMQRRDCELVEQKRKLKEELQACREQSMEGEVDGQEDGQADGQADGQEDATEYEQQYGQEDDETNASDGNGVNDSNAGNLPKKKSIVRNKIVNIKKKIHEINEELLEISNFFLEDKKKREQLIHEYRGNITLVRNILTQVLGIRNPKGGSKDINLNNVHYAILQSILDKHSSLHLIIGEMKHLFDKEIKKYENEKNIHIPYLKQNTMKEIWEYVRLFYNVICYIDPIDLVKSLTYQKGKIMATKGGSAASTSGVGASTSGVGASDRCTNAKTSLGGRGTDGKRANARGSAPTRNYKRGSFLNSRKNNLMIMHLSRINPLLAKTKVRKPNEDKHMKKKKKKFIERKSLIDHYENFSFDDLSFNIFEEEDSFKKYDILNIFDHKNLYKVQDFINTIVGINEEFEGVYDDGGCSSGVKCRDTYDRKGSKKDKRRSYDSSNGDIDDNANYHHAAFSKTDNRNYDGFNYCLKVFLNICIKDLRRCIMEYYNYQWDVKIILNIHAWIVTYYTNFYVYENRKRLNNARIRIRSSKEGETQRRKGNEENTPNSKRVESNIDEDKNCNSIYRSTVFISRIQMVLGMQMYIGENSLHSEFLCDTFHRIIKEEKMSKNSSKVILCCLRCLYADLNLINLHALSTDDNVKTICKSSLDYLLKRNILNTLSWVLKNFKVMSHEKNIFIYSLKCSLLIIQLLEKLGGTTYIVKESKRIYDEEEDEDEEEEYAYDREKGLMNHPNRSRAYGNRYGSRHGQNSDNKDQYHYNDSMERINVCDLVDEIYSGKIVNICMQILENFKRNSIHINDLIITYFEHLIKHKNNEYNFLLFLDVKYFLIFGNIMNDEQCYSCPQYYWIMNFFENIIGCFFKLWNNNYFLPTELFFSKDVNKNLSSLLSEKYMFSIFSNYNEGNDVYIYDELTKGTNINDIFVELNNRKRLEALEWSKEDVQNLKLYFKQFKHMHNFIPFISEMLNKSSNTVKNQLIYLNYIDKRGNVIDQHDYMASSSRSGSSRSGSSRSGSSRSWSSRSASSTASVSKLSYDPSKRRSRNVESSKSKLTKDYLKRKNKLPLLYTIYRLKKLNEPNEKDDSPLTSNEINCDICTVLGEINISLKSLYELKKLSKNKYFSNRALAFDIPLSMSRDLLEHPYFKKLLKLLGFIYNKHSNEWVLNENVDVDVFRKMIDKFEELHELPIEQLRERLSGVKKGESGEGNEQWDEYQDEQLNEPSDEQREDHMHDPKMKGEPDEEETRWSDKHAFMEEHELVMLHPAKVKGMFNLLKCMYEFFIANDDYCRMFFINLTNTIGDKYTNILDMKTKKEGEKDRISTDGDNTKEGENDTNKVVHLFDDVEMYRLYLNKEEKDLMNKCHKRDVFERILEYLGIYVYKSERLILSKHINEKKFFERIKVINDYKTLGVQDIQNLISKKEEEIREKKKRKSENGEEKQNGKGREDKGEKDGMIEREGKEKNPTAHQKFGFIKAVCEYLNYRHVTTKGAHNGKKEWEQQKMETQEEQEKYMQARMNEVYFGDDNMLNALYEKLNSWNNKRNKKKIDEDQNFLLDIKDILICTSIELNDHANDDTQDNNIASNNNYMTVMFPFFINICLSLKGKLAGDNNQLVKWVCDGIHKRWLRVMLKLFYNILFDSAYNTVGKLFSEYKNIKEILNDHSPDFLDAHRNDRKMKKNRRVEHLEEQVDLQVGAEGAAVDGGEGGQIKRADDGKIDQLKSLDAKAGLSEMHIIAEESDEKIKLNYMHSLSRNSDMKNDSVNELSNEINHFEFKQKRKIDHMTQVDFSHFAHFFKKRKLENVYINTYKKNRKDIIESLIRNKNIYQYKESDIINRVKQVVVKARQMASNGDLRTRWKSRDDVRKILLL